MAAPGSSRRPEGFRHSSHCQSRAGDSCSCRPSYQAQVFSPADRKTIRKTFRTLSDARAWRAQAKTELDRGSRRAPTRTTLREAAEEWLKAAEAGIVRTRSGDRYKPSALRAYEQALRTKVLPRHGHLRLSALTSSAVQDLVDRLVADGPQRLDGPKRRPPLRAIYDRIGRVTAAQQRTRPTTATGSSRDPSWPDPIPAQAEAGGREEAARLPRCGDLLLPRSDRGGGVGTEALRRASAHPGGRAGARGRAPAPAGERPRGPTEWRLRLIQSALREAVGAGETVYVHCWGGVGRTGTVVGCRRVETDGISGQHVLARIEELRRGTQRAHRGSPETPAQRDMILGWHKAAFGPRS